MLLVFYILGIQYINTEEIMVSASVFLDKEFTTFIKNGVFGKCAKYLNNYPSVCYAYIFMVST